MCCSINKTSNRFQNINTSDSYMLLVQKEVNVIGIDRIKRKLTSHEPIPVVYALTIVFLFVTLANIKSVKKKVSKSVLTKNIDMAVFTINAKKHRGVHIPLN